MRDADRARDALRTIDAGCPRQEWAVIGMAAKDAGLELDDFIEWSRNASNFGGEKDCAAAWRSFKSGHTTAATLFAKALEAGWRPPADDKEKPKKRPQEPRRTVDKARRPPFDFAAVWRDSEAATAEHPYVVRKLGLPEGLRVYRGPLRLAGQALDGALLVPALDPAGTLRSWQAIPAGDGKKLNAAGASLAGASFIVGGAPRDGEPLYLVEGIAAAWSAHQASGKAAAVCFGAGNVETVAALMRERFAAAHLVVVADRGKEGDAERIASAVGGSWCELPPDWPPNSDVNDLHQRAGLQAVAELLAHPIEPEAPERPSYAELANLDTDPPPPRKWVVRDWLPSGTTTSLFGGGGIGKSLFIQQLATCIANGVPALGQAVTMGPVLAFLCEDDNEEIRRRQAAILAHLGRSAAQSAAGLHIEGRAGLDNTMITFGPDRKPVAGPFLAVLERECERIRPAVLMLDNIAQLFGGIENDRHQVTVFANLLTGIAQRFRCAVLLLGHVAKVEGSEYSGSTAWEAAVRTRLWMERRADGLIELHRRKANYAGLASVLFEYRHGALAEIGDERGDESAAVRAAEAVVLEALATLSARQTATSHLPTARNNLIGLAAKGELLKGTPPAVAARALARLIDAGRIVPNCELPWRKADRHKASGLAEAPQMELGHE